MSTVNQCTPEEIEAKRKLALELRKKRKASEQQKADPAPHPAKRRSSNENRIAMDRELTALLKPDNKAPALTNEQKAQIEKNRLDALARAAANKIITSDQAESLAANKIIPGKIVPPILRTSGNVNLKPVATTNPHTSNSIFGAKPASAGSSKMTTAQSTKKPAGTKPKDPVLCKLRFVTEDRFAASTDSYSELLIAEFKKIPSKSYSK